MGKAVVLLKGSKNTTVILFFGSTFATFVLWIYR